MLHSTDLLKLPCKISKMETLPSPFPLKSSSPKAKFGDSEPNSNRDIEAFAKGNYGVSFPIFSKIKILGSEAEPAFRFLVDSTKKEPRWNFWKYLVNPQGQVVKTWRPEEHFESMKGDVAAMVREIIKKRREDL
ncbi:PREDICTED: probable glutathione peroxidase 8 isoform X3 [Nanorana parkeri]|uniref:probable glutathione peroxidase 8 isoform X3 n=1 Tax=Nanorana parkeri TaxID=125878 RepID=UPI0008543144|nr:PREDICTED: probable glutathione peroxidase 8 isoform X3 [Nanorana parkeri]